MSKALRKYRNMAVIWFFGACLLSMLAVFSANKMFLLVGCLSFVIGFIYVLAYRKAKKIEEQENEGKGGEGIKSSTMKNGHIKSAGKK